VFVGQFPTVLPRGVPNVVDVREFVDTITALEDGDELFRSGQFLVTETERIAGVLPVRFGPSV